MDKGLTMERCVVRQTASHRGRRLSVRPGESAMRLLHYGRIVLAAGDKPVQFSTGTLETGLLCLGGRARVRIADKEFGLSPYDGLYVPRDNTVEVSVEGERCDLAEIAAPVEGRYPLQHIPFAELQKNSSLCFKTGGPSFERTVNIVFGKNVEAGRIMAGVTFSAPGHWTSWPPHEHTVLAEEAYVYFDMPRPSFGIQLVYTDAESPELAVIVHDGDCVLMPSGYHPNVSAPGSTINFLWMMAATRETVDRQFGVVNVQPEYASGGSGLESSRR
jgi:5-deoxy-glucuronate isomerase